MYTGYGFRDFEIGDVDVLKDNGIYHLFHLTLPNHDYIAHAVSDDGLKWQRVKNALFISDPMAWDDDMLWTMHVSPDPYRPGAWRMFYTGLSMGERGRVQRVGMARSNDLYNWHKDNSGIYPLEIPADYYESTLQEGRHWVSFRDPYFFRENGQGYLLAAGRVNTGPIIRRGCVAMAREVSENQFEFYPPLFHPMHYDDVEVPNLIKRKERYYLIGSIREDVKVHYWYADELAGPYRNFYDNVLLPQGNYAARVTQEGEKHLIWNFFFRGLTTEGQHLMAPPKELIVDNRGELRLRSFEGFKKLIIKTLEAEALAPLQPLFNNRYASSSVEDISYSLHSESGFEAFLLQGVYQDFILSGMLDLEGDGKCGLLLRLDDKGDGYYISLDLSKGIGQIRAWSHKPDGDGDNAFHYDQLQAAHYIPTDGPHQFSLLAFEQYLEFSLDGFVLLTLADDQFEGGKVGFYVESATMQIADLRLELYGSPQTDSYPDGIPNY